jgi:hypothetical protein
VFVLATDIVVVRGTAVGDDLHIVSVEVLGGGDGRVEMVLAAGT